MPAFLGSRRVATFPAPAPDWQYRFDNGNPMPAAIVFTRASVATDSLYTDAAGSSYNTYAVDAPRLVAGRGYLHEQSRVNRLLASTVPITQTTASLATGTYTLWIIGTGSATSSAGTATGTGFGAATAGVPNVFTLTGTGTVVVTVAGTVNRFQLELGSYPTSFIETTVAVVTRSADLAHIDMDPGGYYTIAIDALMHGAGDSTTKFLYDFTDASTPVERMGSLSSGAFYPSATIRNDSATASVSFAWATAVFGDRVGTVHSVANGWQWLSTNGVLWGQNAKRASVLITQLIIGAIQLNGTQSECVTYKTIKFWRNKTLPSRMLQLSKTGN